MRIAQVAPRYYPVLGGVEEVVKHYSEGLVNLGHEVEVYTSKEGSSRSNEVVNNVVVHRYSTLPISPKLPYVPISLGMPQKLGETDFDIYHLHANKRFTTDLSALVLRAKRKKLIFSPHAGQFGSSFLGKLHNKLFGRLTLDSNLVICVSEYEKKLITKEGFRSTNIRVLANGVDIEEFSGVKQGFFEDLGWKDIPVITSIGRLVPHKNVDLLIKAVKILVNQGIEVRLAVIGPDGGQGKDLRSLVLSVGLDNHVDFLGALSRNDLVRALKDSTIFCLPSSSEAFGLVIIEAMAAGVPVIGTDMCAIPEVIDNEKNGLLTRLDEKDLAEKIKTLLNNRKLAHSLSEQGRKSVKEKYDWVKIVKILESWYKEIL